MHWEEKSRGDTLVKDLLRTEDTPRVCGFCQLVWAVRSHQSHMMEGSSLRLIDHCPAAPSPPPWKELGEAGELTAHPMSTQENTKLGLVCPQLYIHPQLYFYPHAHPADSSSIFLCTFRMSPGCMTSLGGGGKTGMRGSDPSNRKTCDFK